MRRHLGMSEQEWTTTPWHVQRAYRDGLVKELKLRRRGETVLVAVEKFLGIEYNDDPVDPVDLPAASADELRRSGVTVN